MRSRRTVSSLTEDRLRQWRLLVNQFELEAADCRELLRRVQTTARSDGGSEEATLLLSQARRQMLHALRSFEEGVSATMEQTTNALGAVLREHEMRALSVRQSVESLRRRLSVAATHSTR